MAIQNWAVKAPKHVVWTPEEMAQVGLAIQDFQRALPGSQPMVTLKRLKVLTELRQACDQQSLDVTPTSP